MLKIKKTNKKPQRGIFGIKTTKPIFFKINGELWPSDDSDDDEDYDVDLPSFTSERVPSSPTKLKLKRNPVGTKRKKTNKKKNGTVKKAKLSSVQDDKDAIPWGTRIPENVLVKIFQYVVRSEGVLYLKDTLSQVCCLWNKVAFYPLLWQKVDLSYSKMPEGYTEVALQELCRSQLISPAKEISLDGWATGRIGKMVEMMINHITVTCPTLFSLSLNRCRISSECLKLIADKVPNLSKLDLSATCKSYNPSNHLSEATMKYLLSACAGRITYLSLAQNAILQTFQHTLTRISEYCPNLEVLDLSNLVYLSNNKVILPLEVIQKGCPQLRVFLLANFRFSLPQATGPPLSPGFKKLEELSIATSAEGGFSYDDNDLERLTRDSNKLRLLDIRGCSKVTVSGLVRIPAWDLRHLFIAQCGATRFKELELVFSKWAHSLETVDLSGTVNIEAVNLSCLTIASSADLKGPSPLSSLNLNNTAITLDSVKKLLEKCTHLQHLNLQSCRSLPRGIKREYKSESLRTLREDIKKGTIVE